jgi:hypothetical protein
MVYEKFPQFTKFVWKALPMSHSDTQSINTCLHSDFLFFNQINDCEISSCLNNELIIDTN